MSYYAQSRQMSGREIGMQRARARRRELNMLAFRDVLAAEPESFRQWLAGPKCPRFLSEALTDWGRLTDNQLACAKRIFAEDTEKQATRRLADLERAAKAPAWVAGRLVITGTVEFAQYRDTPFGPALKAVIMMADGRKLWTSLPSAMTPDVKGSVVTLKVTIKPSENDATMAFGSRPVVAE